MSTKLTPATIKVARDRLGLTQEQFAARLGCSTQAVSFWERGTRTPTGLYAREVQRLLAEAETADPALTPPPPALPAR